MEVFVKVIAEHLATGERRIASTAFLTFVALDQNGNPQPVPQVVPETNEELKLYETAPLRAESRKRHRMESKELAHHLNVEKFWDAGPVW